MIGIAVILFSSAGKCHNGYCRRLQTLINTITSSYYLLILFIKLQLLCCLFNITKKKSNLFNHQTRFGITNPRIFCLTTNYKSISFFKTKPNKTKPNKTKQNYTQIHNHKRQIDNYLTKYLIQNKDRLKWN